MGLRPGFGRGGTVTELLMGPFALVALLLVGALPCLGIGTLPLPGVPGALSVFEPVESFRAEYENEPGWPF